MKEKVTIVKETAKKSKKKKRISIFTISVFNDKDIDNPSYLSLPEMDTSGFYTDKNTAYKAVTENWCDIQERCYDYALIEEVQEGLYGTTNNRQFFEWNEDTKEFVPIEEPKKFKHWQGLSNTPKHKIKED